MRKCKHIHVLNALLWPPCWLPIIVMFSAPALKAQERCATETAKAEEKYQQGGLNEAINLLNNCLRKGNLVIAESKQAYRLLAKAYLSKGQLNRAKDNLQVLLRVAPDWKPDPEMETPSFMVLADEVIAEVELKKAREAREQALTPSLSDKIEIGIGGGLAVPKGPVPEFSDSSKTGLTFNLHVDLYLNPQSTLGGSVTFLTFDKKFLGPEVRGDHLNIIEVLAQFKYYLQPPQNRWRAYLVGGLGFAFSRRADRVAGPISTEGAGGNDMAFAMGLGLKIRVGANTKLIVEGLVSNVFVDNPKVSGEVLTYLPFQMAIVF